MLHVLFSTCLCACVVAEATQSGAFLSARLEARPNMARGKRGPWKGGRGWFEGGRAGSEMREPWKGVFKEHKARQRMRTVLQPPPPPPSPTLNTQVCGEVIVALPKPFLIPFTLGPPHTHAHNSPCVSFLTSKEATMYVGTSCVSASDGRFP